MSLGPHPPTAATARLPGKCCYFFLLEAGSPDQQLGQQLGPHEQPSLGLRSYGVGILGTRPQATPWNVAPSELGPRPADKQTSARTGRRTRSSRRRGLQGGAARQTSHRGEEGPSEQRRLVPPQPRPSTKGEGWCLSPFCTGRRSCNVKGEVATSGERAEKDHPSLPSALDQTKGRRELQGPRRKRPQDQAPGTEQTGGGEAATPAQSLSWSLSSPWPPSASLPPWRVCIPRQLCDIGFPFYSEFKTESSTTWVISQTQTSFSQGH